LSYHREFSRGEPQPKTKPRPQRHRGHRESQRKAGLKRTFVPDEESAFVVEGHRESKRKAILE
jgi:IS5 family transposase